MTRQIIDTAFDELIDANQAFWQTHDHLIEEGNAINGSVRWHPDYQAADARCIAASKTMTQGQAS